MPLAPFSPPSPNAADNSAHEHTKHVDEVAAEKRPLGPPRQAGFFSRRRITGAVVKDYGDYALLVCCLVTGMVDAACFGNWGCVHPNRRERGLRTNAPY